MLPDEAPRLFIAIQLPDEVIQALAATQDKLRRSSSLHRLRWVRPNGIHLTLKFLGDTPARQIPAIEQAIESAAADLPPARLRLGHPGTFGSRTAPRVLWVGIEGDISPVSVLHQRIDRGLAAIGFPGESRPFSPHLTLARVPPERSRELASEISQAIERVPAPDVAFTARSIALVRSDLRPSGAIYTSLFSRELSYSGSGRQPE